MSSTNYTSVDEYIAAQPEPSRAVLERVRATIRKALPRATEGISYQIPVYKLDVRMVLYFAGFQRHYSIYPATAYIAKTLKKELTGLLHSKATIRFAYTDAAPARLISRIAKLRAAEVAELQHQRAKGTKRTSSNKGKSKPRSTPSNKRQSRDTPFNKPNARTTSSTKR